MGSITVIMNTTLDGVVQAPGRADEDPRDGFTHGGWAAPYTEGDDMDAGQVDGLLFGRRTYEGFASFWPHQTDGNPFTPVLDAMPKYVVSRTLTAPPPWRGSTVVGDLDAVAALRAEHELVVLGSGELVGALVHSSTTRTGVVVAVYRPERIAA